MYRTIRVLLLLICLSLADASVVSAAPKNKVADPPSKSYVVPYFLVGLCVGLGLLVVCRSGSRADQAKDTDLD